MELFKYFAIARKWFWLIFLATLLAAGSSFFVSKSQTPIYRTSTTLMVSQITQNSNPNSGDIYASQQLAQTYVQLITREPILSATANALGLGQDWESLKGQVSAIPIEGTQLLEVSVIDSSPQRAQAIANEVAHQLILQSPANTGDKDQIAFIQNQLPELENKIKKAREQVTQLDQVISSANSARAIQDAQNQQDMLNNQINQWQNTYAQLTYSLNQSSLNTINVVEPAPLPYAPISPNVNLNVLVAAAIGFSLSIGGVLLLEYLDDTIRSPDEARSLLELPILGIIGKISGLDYSEMLVAALEPRSPITEAYRELRTNLRFSTLDAQLRTLVITSAGPAEGKSINAANLAVVLAQAGISVLLVDADLRKPVQHKIFGVNNHTGLTNWLAGEEGGNMTGWVSRDAAEEDIQLVGFENCQQVTKIPGLRLVTSGPLPPNPAEVLGSERMRQFLIEATNFVDIVILDSPPCVTVTDSVVLSQWVDGVLLVIDNQFTSRQGAKRARENLGGAFGNRLLGIVFNRLKNTQGGYYNNYSYSYYYSDDEKGHNNGRHGKNGRKIAWKGLFNSSRSAVAATKDDTNDYES
jgi:polysaccharide biosynthesis transport protein